MRRRWTRIDGPTAILVATLIGTGAVQAQAPDVEVIVDRLGTYLLDYETKVFEIAVEEQYDQWIKRRPGYGGATVAKRKLRSTFFLVRLPDGHAWYGFREVSSVDGRPIASRRSMSALLSERTTDAYQEALAITRESARYNIGGVYRTINLPMQALELLHPQFRHRFRFQAAGTARIEREPVVEIEFEEHTRPTIVSDGFEGDLLAHGRVWVSPVSGAVLRTELGFTAPGNPLLKETLIRVDYRRDPKLQVLLPWEMAERYGLDIEVVHGRANYRNYRRFQTGARLVTPPK